MSKDLIPNEKQIVSGINKAFDKMENTKKSYVQLVIELGEKLIEAKKLAGHGNWEALLKRHSQFRFNDRQARKFMQIATHKYLVLEYFKGESSIDGITLAISDATDEQFKKAEELMAIEEQKQAAAKIERDRKIAELASPIKDEIEDGEFIEITNEVAIIPIIPIVGTLVEDNEEDNPEGYISQLDEMDLLTDEIHYANEDLRQENDYLTKIMSADDKLAKALEELRIQKILNKSLQDSNDQKTNTIARLQEEVQNLQKKIKRFMKVSNG